MNRTEHRDSSAALTLTIHLVRHGETDWNREGRLQGWTDVPLNPTGIEQARAAASALGSRSIGMIVSSDLSRARATAELIATTAGVKVETDPALRERRYGVAEGQLRVDLDRQFGGRFAERWDDPDFAFERGETRRELYERLGRFLTALLVRPANQEIVLVSHGGSLHVARGFLEGIPVERLPRWSFVNGSVTTVEIGSHAGRRS